MKPARWLATAMSELLFMACTVFAGLVACLANPGAPEEWSCVKPARRVGAPLTAPAGYELERDSEPGFADGLSSSALT